MNEPKLEIVEEFGDLVIRTRSARGKAYCVFISKSWLPALRKHLNEGMVERWIEVMSDDVHFKTVRIFDTYDDFVAYHSDSPLTRHIPVEAIPILVPAEPAT